MAIVKTGRAQAALADRWFAKRAERLAAAKVATSLEAEERDLKQDLIDSMVKYDVGTIGGRLVKAEHITKKKPIVDDWPALYEHIKDTDSFDLLQRRLGEAAVKARWDLDEDIPGVASFPVDDISYSKVKD